MKTIDEREIQRTKKEKQLKAGRSKETEAIVKGWEQNDFAVHLS